MASPTANIFLDKAQRCSNTAAVQGTRSRVPCIMGVVCTCEVATYEEFGCTTCTRRTLNILEDSAANPLTSSSAAGDNESGS